MEKPTGQLTTLTDAQNQTATCSCDDSEFKLTEQYPNHTGGSPGNSTYGIVSFTPDAAGRVLRKQDQAGDKCTYNYDLAGRLTSSDYRTSANSPSGSIADSDTFTNDNSGRMLTAVSGRYTNTVTYTYHTAGRKKTEKLAISGQDYTTQLGYKSRGELTRYGYEYPDEAVVERECADWLMKWLVPLLSLKTGVMNQVPTPSI